MNAPLRVRIHLNLAKPELAENAVRVLTPSGSWSTIGYASELLLQNCTPVVNLASQKNIEAGKSRKVPHAFIEGDLIHFQGRLRKLAPQKAKDLASGRLVSLSDFPTQVSDISSQGHAVNYNPRFATCFYFDQPTREMVSQRFVSSKSMAVVGWKFWASDPVFHPLSTVDYCSPSAISLASPSEKSILRRGHNQTSTRIAQLIPAKPSMRRP